MYHVECSQHIICLYTFYSFTITRDSIPRTNMCFSNVCKIVTITAKCQTENNDRKK